MDTVRIIKALFNISNAPRFKNHFENNIYVRFGYAYVANSIAIMRVQFPFVREHGFDDWESIYYDEHSRMYLFQDSIEPSTRFDELVRYPKTTGYGFSRFDPVELARILRVFSACNVEPMMYIFDNSEMILEAFKKEISIEAKLMGMR